MLSFSDSKVMLIVFKALSATERAPSTSAIESINCMYLIQTKLLFGEVLTAFSNSSVVRGASFSSKRCSAALICRSFSSFAFLFASLLLFSSRFSPPLSGSISVLSS
uniref:Uncharacterized protein n=1 Tax=Opuntia streptacantha TaxID=393608 RepID=A0A7C8YLJ1_OPUST